MLTCQILAETKSAEQKWARELESTATAFPVIPFDFNVVPASEASSPAEYGPIVFVDADYAKTPTVCDGYLDRGEGHVGMLVEMETQHLRVIHLVDVIAREDQNVGRLFARDRINVLIDRVGRAKVPMLTDAFLRRQDLDELPELF